MQGDKSRINHLPIHFKQRTKFVDYYLKKKTRELP